MTPLQVIPPRVALADPRTGLISREWYLFFLRLFERSEAPGLDLGAITDRVDGLESDLSVLASDVNVLTDRVDVLTLDGIALDGRVDVLEARALAHAIEDEGIALTQRTTINFAGAGVTVTDSGGKTLVTIPGGGGGGGGGSSYFPSGF